MVARNADKILEETRIKRIYNYTQILSDMKVGLKREVGVKTLQQIQGECPILGRKLKRQIQNYMQINVQLKLGDVCKQNENFTRKDHVFSRVCWMGDEDWGRMGGVGVVAFSVTKSTLRKNQSVKKFAKSELLTATRLRARGTSISDMSATGEDVLISFQSEFLFTFWTKFLTK
jgi:hypothetical protein